MNILISGGTGFIGSELRDFFLRDGHHLTIISRTPEKYAEETARNQAFISWDDNLVAAMEEADVVINLVGEIIFGKLWTDAVKKRLYSSRVENTRRLVEVIEKADTRPALFISTSGVSYYGDSGDTILAETAPPGDTFLARLAVDWEKAAEPVTGLGVRLVIFRNGAVLEKGGGPIQYLYPLFKFGLGGSVGDGTQYFPWIHMLDVCRAMDFAIEHADFSGTCNLCAPGPVTMNELTKTLGRAMNRPSLFRVPRFILEGILGEAAEPLVVSQRAHPVRLLEAGFGFRFDSLEEALIDIIT